MKFIQKKLDEMFPLRNIRNVSLYYILTSTYNLWFVSAIWVFIWGRIMSRTEIGISDSITFTFGFLMELPSGVFADFIGRKKAIFIASILMVVGNLGVGLSNAFGTLTVWYLIWTLGYALQSGSVEALAYDSTKLKGVEDQWNKVVGTGVIIARVSAMAASVIGGYLFTIWFRLPYIVFAVSGLIAIVASYLLTEIPVNIKGSLWSIKSYLSQIRDGFSVLKKNVVFPIALTSLITAGLAYIYNWGLLRPLTAERFGYAPSQIPLLLLVVSLSVIIATNIFVKNNKNRVEKMIMSFSLVFALAFLLLYANWGLALGGILMIIVATTASIVEQFFSQFINLHTASEHRATTLSAVALITRLPYTALAFILGVMADNKSLPVFCVIAGSIALIMFVISLVKNKQINNYKF